MARNSHFNFGCGSNLLPDPWRNVDLDRPDERDRIDVTKPLPILSDTVDRAMAEHLGEHLDSRELTKFLTEVYRILKPGGVFRMCCPVVGPWLTRAHAEDLAAGNGHRVLLTEETMRTFLWIAGFDQHKIRRTDRHPDDGHARQIGVQKDDIETCRLEASK